MPVQASFVGAWANSQGQGILQLQMSNQSPARRRGETVFMNFFLEAVGTSRFRVPEKLAKPPARKFTRLSIADENQCYENEYDKERKNHRLPIGSANCECRTAQTYLSAESSLGTQATRDRHLCSEVTKGVGSPMAAFGT